MEVITLQESKDSRIYNFIEYNEKTGVYVHKQLENRNGNLFMRSKVRTFQISVSEEF